MKVIVDPTEVKVVPLKVKVVSLDVKVVSLEVKVVSLEVKVVHLEVKAVPLEVKVVLLKFKVVHLTFSERNPQNCFNILNKPDWVVSLPEATLQNKDVIPALYGDAAVTRSVHVITTSLVHYIYL